MLKFAFLIDIPGLTPKEYGKIYKNEESYNLIAGIDGNKYARKYVKTLISKGFTVFNLSGDFDDETVAQIKEDAGEDIEIHCARYSIDELFKLEMVEKLDEYGVIIAAPGVERPKQIILENKACKTIAVFVKDMKQAKYVAQKLVVRRVKFIELSSWFDRLMMEEIVDSIRGVIPIGTCGDLDLVNL